MFPIIQTWNSPFIFRSFSFSPPCTANQFPGLGQFSPCGLVCTPSPSLLLALTTLSAAMPSAPHSWIPWPCSGPSLCLWSTHYQTSSPMTPSLGGGGLVPKSCPTLATPRTVVCQTPLSMGFSRQEHWSVLPFPWSLCLDHFPWSQCLPNTGECGCARHVWTPRASPCGHHSPSAAVPSLSYLRTAAQVPLLGTFISSILSSIYFLTISLKCDLYLNHLRKPAFFWNTSLCDLSL